MVRKKELSIFDQRTIDGKYGLRVKETMRKYHSLYHLVITKYDGKSNKNVSGKDQLVHILYNLKDIKSLQFENKDGELCVKAELLSSSQKINKNESKFINHYSARYFPVNSIPGLNIDESKSGEKIPPLVLLGILALIPWIYIIPFFENGWDNLLSFLRINNKKTYVDLRKRSL